MFYITFSENSGGVYKGQVIDVCNFLNDNFKVDITLVAFISIRNFFVHRSRIKKQFSRSIVLPMTPKMNTWKWNVVVLYILCFIKKPKVAICRNVLATNLALIVRKRGILKTVCYDGRGASAAEFEEYLFPDCSNDSPINIEELERKAVRNSDFRIAVSAKLIKYWKKRYGYISEEHVVIPCTVSQHFCRHKFDEENKKTYRLKLGFQSDDILFVYAGSTAGWQSFELLRDFLDEQLCKGKEYKVLFLSREDENNNALKKKYPEQVAIKWVNSSEVSAYLSMCDYGLLLREPSVTNKVAAPTKFAEYLASGLDIIISPGIGDYSDFVREHECGKIVSKKKSVLKLSNSLRIKKRKKNIELAQKYFSKSSNRVIQKYNLLVQRISRD